MPKIYVRVEIRDGVVHRVYSDAPAWLHLVVVDYDNPKEDALTTRVLVDLNTNPRIYAEGKK